MFINLSGEFMKRIPRRLLTEEFKTEAIKLVTEQHMNAAQAGRQPWCREADGGSTTHP